MKPSRADAVRYWAGVVASVSGLVAAAGALVFEDAREQWQQAAPARVVAALPGVGAGWLDTLQRVAGPFEIDTLTAVIIESYAMHGALGGLYESWYRRVRVSTDMRVYFILMRGICADADGATVWSSYTHPPEIANPAAVLAHEVGHHFQATLPDSTALAREWRSTYGERFADRFARSMLVIRGWLPADTSDAVLLHVLSYRLRRSYWEAP